MAFSYFVVLNREAETLWICSEFVFRSEFCVNVQGRRKKCLYLKWQFHNFMETESIVAHCYHAQWILSDKLIHVWRSPISFSNSNMWCMYAPHIIRHFPSFVLQPLCFSYQVNMRQLKKTLGLSNVVVTYITHPFATISYWIGAIPLLCSSAIDRRKIIPHKI